MGNSYKAIEVQRDDVNWDKRNLEAAKVEIERLRVELAGVKSRIENSPRGWSIFGKEKQIGSMFYDRKEAENWARSHTTGFASFDVREVAIVVL